MFKKFKKCKNDVERWKWLIDNKEGFTIILDNDDTMVVFKEGEVIHLDCYLGNSEGIECLLKIIGIKSRMV